MRALTSTFRFATLAVLVVFALNAQAAAKRTLTVDALAP